MNTMLKDQLQKALQSGKLKVKYPDGYKKWKNKFDHFYSMTKDVHQTLDIIYGPKGGVNHYTGSLYRNSNLKSEQVESSNAIKQPKKFNKYNKAATKHNKSFNFLKNKEKTSK